jgi:hypothetical protein
MRNRLNKIKEILRSEIFISFTLLMVVSGLSYLPFINRFGYYNDDWYLMYAAGAKGPMVFRDIFSVDRPLRALVMIPAYSIFGGNPLYYNLSVFLVRLIGGIAFLWILRLLWPGQDRVTRWTALLFIIYPGFLSQPNAIDYLCHLFGLAAGFLSIALTIKAIQAGSWRDKLLFYFSSILLGWFYLGQIEWFIGLEFLRFACVLLLSFRMQGTVWQNMVRFLRWASPFILVPGVFLIWRLVFFVSERGATDVELHFSFWEVAASPMTFIINWSSTLLNDALSVLVRAWVTPLQRFSYALADRDWITGYAIAALVLIVMWSANRLVRDREGKPSEKSSGWRQEAIWIALGTVVFGLLPVILVGRSIDFRSYSRYTLVASAGAVLLWQVGLGVIPFEKLRNVLMGLLVVLAALTHYANGLAHVRETEAVHNFWWQVSWRIPQMDIGTTLVAHYFIVAEEDYFVWGPANLIYYPESIHERYVQPGIYAALLNGDTISKVLGREPQEFSNRRSIRTYPNYHNILVVTQPTLNSCVQVIDGRQVELSSAEDERLISIAAFSETEHIQLEEPFHTPPEIPFGPQPARGWCYYYEKASFARQAGEWDKVASLGDVALSQGLLANDSIEWLPLLQAYAHFDNADRLNQLASLMASDPVAVHQACQTLMAMPLSPSIQKQARQLFCNENR